MCGLYIRLTSVLRYGKMSDGTTTNTSEGREEKAVSPVIGVILMVSITVIVAATTGALLTGSAFTDIEQPATSGVTFN